MSNTVAERRQFDNSQECIAKKRQWRRHANENTPEQYAECAFELSVRGRGGSRLPECILRCSSGVK